MILDVEYLRSAIESFAQRHPGAVRSGGEYIYQDDEAQVDAVDLVADIFDQIAEDTAEDEAND